MELIVASLVTVPWTSLFGLALTVAGITVLVTLAFHAGLYYSLPRIVVKALGQSVLRHA
jgi:hypothetical protein